MSLDRLLYAEQAGNVFTADDLKGVHAALLRIVGRQAILSFGVGESVGLVGSPAHLAVTAGGGSGLAVSVGNGYGWIAEDAQNFRFYLVHESATTVFNGFDAADPSLDRVDLLCVHARDTDIDAGGHNDAVYEVVKGTNGGGTPADPGLQYMVLAEVTIHAAHTTLVSGDIKDRRVPIGTLTATQRAVVAYSPGSDQSTPSSEATWPTGLTQTVAVPVWAVSARCYAKIGRTGAAGISEADVKLKFNGTTVDTRRVLATSPLTQDVGDLILVGDIDVTALQGQTGIVVHTTAVIVGVAAAITALAGSNHYLEVQFSADTPL